jgi:hypothetical protein
VTSQQHALRSAQYQLVNESAALDNEELRWVEAFDSLSHSLATAQERQRKLVAAQAVATRQAARAGDEAQQLAQQLVEAAARAGELASLALAKIRERMLVVKQVQAIKKELKESDSLLLFCTKRCYISARWRLAWGSHAISCSCGVCGA